MPKAHAALGWASLAIGLTELAAPKLISKLLGIDDTPQTRGVLRVLGVRKIGHGVGILTEDEPNGKLTGASVARGRRRARHRPARQGRSENHEACQFRAGQRRRHGHRTARHLFPQRLTRDQMQ